MENVSSAYWLDVIGKIECGNTSCADGILADSAKKGNQLVTFIVYDLPNRDCHAKASNGEICCTTNPDGTCNYDAGGDCSAAIARYKSSYIDALVRVFSKYPSVPIVAIVEPDSLPNLATNQGDPHCGNSATTAAYTIGIPYAVSSLTKLSHVSVRHNSKFVFFPLFIDLHLATTWQIFSSAAEQQVYLDAAHGGWLGWQNNIATFTTLLRQIGIPSMGIRGFSTNVANYQPLGVACPQPDWCLPNSGHQGDECCNGACMPGTVLFLLWQTV